jgi:hypothetical protein
MPHARTFARKWNAQSAKQAGSERIDAVREDMRVDRGILFQEKTMKLPLLKL